MGLAVGVTGQGMTDGIKVDLPYRVTIGDTVLEPGEYEIRRASQNQDQILRIFSNDKMRYETHVITVPALDKDTPEETKVVLHHIGDDYYFDKIWIQGKDYGYEFVLPERAQALKRELAASVPATYMPQVQVSESNQAPASTTTQSASSATAGAAAGAISTQTSQAEIDRQAQAERDRQAELAAQANRAEQDRQAAAAAAQAERDRQLEIATQAERDRQAQAQRESTVDTRVAQVQSGEVQNRNADNLAGDN